MEPNEQAAPDQEQELKQKITDLVEQRLELAATLAQVNRERKKIGMENYQEPDQAAEQAPAPIAISGKAKLDLLLKVRAINDNTKIDDLKLLADQAEELGLLKLSGKVLDYQYHKSAGRVHRAKTELQLLKNEVEIVMKDLARDPKLVSEFADTFKFSAVTNWENTPELFRKTVKVSPAKKFDFEDFEELYKALKPILGTDELRPVMSGIFFDSTAGEIAATDAHKLIRIKHPTTRSGIYTLNKAKSIEPIEGQYMRYNAVIPTKDFVISGPVDVEKILAYINCASYFANISAHTVQFIVGDQKIGFNGEFLTEVITAMVKLGVKEFTGYYRTPNQAFLLRGKSGEAEITGLAMPLMLHDESKALGASDLDFAFELNSCLNIFTNELTSMQPTGKVTTEPIKTIDTPSGQGSLSPEMIKAIYQGRVKNHTLPILDYACITGGNLLLCNLDTFVKLPVSGIADGIYNITDAGLLKENSYNVEDFPTLNFIEDNKEGKETPGPTLGPADLESMLQALSFTGKDELRPGFTAINMIARNGKLVIGSTDQHSIYVAKSNTPAEAYSVNVTVSPFFNNWLTRLQGPIQTSCKNERINLVGKNFTINQRLIDFKFPDLLNYVAKQHATKVSFTKADYKELLKAARANTKAGLYFDFKNNLVTIKDGTLKTKEVKFTVTERSPEDPIKFTRAAVCLLLAKNQEQEKEPFVNNFGFSFENFTKLDSVLSDEVNFYYTPAPGGIIGKEEAQGLFVLEEEREEDTRKILPLDPAPEPDQADETYPLLANKAYKSNFAKLEIREVKGKWFYGIEASTSDGGTYTGIDTYRPFNTREDCILFAIERIYKFCENKNDPQSKRIKAWADTLLIALSLQRNPDIYNNYQDPAPEPDQDPTDLIEALKIAYEVDPDPDTLELIEALELAAEYN